MQLCPDITTRRLLFFVVSLSVSLLFFFYYSTLLKSNSTESNTEPVLIVMLPNNTPTRSNFRINSYYNEKSSDARRPSLKVYMYDLPPEFHFGLLGWTPSKNETFPDVDANPDAVPRYPGGLNLQHSVEYWLALDLLSPRNAATIRVDDASAADVIFVPFFASLSYNRHSRLRGREKVCRNRLLQKELVRFLMGRDEWRRRGGRDHVVVAHHPNSLLDARRKLGAAMFLLADFGRYPGEVANLEKDVVVPYVHVVGSVGESSLPFDGRTTLVYFQGAIYRKDSGLIRLDLYHLLKDEKDVHFAYGSARGHGIRQAGQGMASSKFCLNIAGDTPSSNRLFDAIVSHCVPVIISDDIELPFEDVLDYSQFAIFVRASDAVKRGFLLSLLRGVSRDEWTSMWMMLRNVARHFEYQYPSREGDAVQMIWEAVARKMSPLRLKINREKRFAQNHI